MNYTKNYHLPQWVKEDRIMMNDFNQMCADMEAGLNKNAQELKTGLNKAAQDLKTGLDKTAQDAAAATAAVSTAVSAAAQQAQDTADAALAKANAAYAPDQPPYKIGSYKGNGEELTIELGFQARFLIIAIGGNSDSYFITGNTTWHPKCFQFTSTGFTVRKNDKVDTGTVASPYEQPPYLVSNGQTYTYIAFR